MQKSTIALVLVAVAAVAIGVGVQQASDKPATLPEFTNTIMLPQSRPFSKFRLVDHHGHEFGPQQLRDYWSILFFGFTHCPDVCPTTLATLAQVKQQMQAKGQWGNYRVLMVSVDPNRDSVERLAEYVPYFDDEFVGITGDLPTLTEFARQAGVVFARRGEVNERDYDVDHSAALILVNPKGQWAGAIPAPQRRDQIIDDLAKLATYYADDHSEQPANKANSALKTEPDGVAQPIADSSAALSVSNAWIRPAPPTASSMVAYFELHNDSAQDITIVAAESPQFAHSMLHSTELVDGVVQMQHIDSLLVPANGRAVLMPMATHLMLMQPHDILAEGSQANISLISDSGQRFDFNVAVRPQPE
ncbi:MAG: copper chaperone PCu(A)C [Gammaproteobacteria bacterium]|nr:copper chaperone PCu(A)C [Gammaproteobacteria bacterium]